MNCGHLDDDITTTATKRPVTLVRLPTLGGFNGKERHSRKEGAATNSLPRAERASSRCMPTTFDDTLFRKPMVAHDAQTSPAPDLSRRRRHNAEIGSRVSLRQSPFSPRTCRMAFPKIVFHNICITSIMHHVFVTEMDVADAPAREFFSLCQWAAPPPRARDRKSVV